MLSSHRDCPSSKSEYMHFGSSPGFFKAVFIGNLVLCGACHSLFDYVRLLELPTVSWNGESECQTAEDKHLGKEKSECETFTGLAGQCF